MNVKLIAICLTAAFGAVSSMPTRDSADLVNDNGQVPTALADGATAQPSTIAADDTNAHLYRDGLTDNANRQSKRRKLLTVSVEEAKKFLEITLDSLDKSLPSTKRIQLAAVIYHQQFPGASGILDFKSIFQMAQRDYQAKAAASKRRLLNILTSIDAHVEGVQPQTQAPQQQVPQNPNQSTKATEGNRFTRIESMPHFKIYLTVEEYVEYKKAKELQQRQDTEEHDKLFRTDRTAMADAVRRKYPQLAQHYRDFVANICSTENAALLHDELERVLKQKFNLKHGGLCDFVQVHSSGTQRISLGVPLSNANALPSTAVVSAAAHPSQTVENADSHPRSPRVQATNQQHMAQLTQQQAVVLAQAQQMAAAAENQQQMVQLTTQQQQAQQERQSQGQPPRTIVLRTPAGHVAVLAPEPSQLTDAQRSQMMHRVVQQSMQAAAQQRAQQERQWALLSQNKNSDADKEKQQ